MKESGCLFFVCESGSIAIGHSTREKSPSKWDALAATPMKPFEEFPAENRNKSILEAVRLGLLLLYIRSLHPY